MDIGQEIQKLNELDFNNMGSWPFFGRLFVILVGMAAVIGAGYWFFVKDKLVELDSVQKKESELRAVFETKQKKAANLEAYRAQMKDMEESFSVLLQQLPKKTEVPGLLEDISYVGATSGLSFNKIQLQGERSVDFYKELPIEIQVSGNYHSIGDFVSEVAQLPRIVTLHNFKLSKSKNSDELDMSITAKTYRYDSEG
ncbi:MAG: pilus assembly protein PilO [Kangiellaceae bacterium]|nr:pilus assembly protein PilO [Kangiellaceae bacterium]|tara:strand:- start:45778 stop:46371 length:594 start_codon:yes stop_codon:yes gene_type:complete